MVKPYKNNFLHYFSSPLHSISNFTHFNKPDLISGRTIPATETVLREILTEAKMMVMHRVHLEILYSNPRQDISQLVSNRRAGQSNEIINLSGDEDMEIETNGLMEEIAEPNHAEQVENGKFLKLQSLSDLTVVIKVSG